MSALRTLTARQGAAIAEFYKTFGIDIELHIQFELPKTFSWPSTNRRNVEAAINYLHGNNVQAALLEMQAAVHFWNNEARVEAVQRSLTPAQMLELRQLDAATGGDVTAVRNDLDGVDRQVYDALASGDIGKANALRLQAQIDTDRSKRRDDGADATVDRIAAASQHSGDDPVSGADPLHLEEQEVQEANQRDRWQQTQRAFGQLQGVPEAEIAKDPGGALHRYAIAARDYQQFVPDQYSEEGGHYETVHEGISRNQERLIRTVIDNGPDSEQAAAARLMVEMNRDGGKPKLDRLDMVTHDPSLDAREGVSREQRRAEDEARKKSDPKSLSEAEAADQRRGRILMLYDQYRMDGQAGPPRSPETVRNELAGQLGAQFAGDPTAAAHAQSMIRDRTVNPQTAFQYALAHDDGRKETLLRTFGRMDRDEIDAAIKQYDDNRGEGPTLYARLGLHGKGSWWTSALSGDERNEVELASMGVPRNTRERAEVARLATQQQIRDSGFLGRLLAHDEYSRMVRNQERLEREMGVKPEDFDDLGRLRKTDPITGRPVILGHFNAQGEFQPPEGGNADALESTIRLSALTAESYRQATDRIATAVTTALVLVAAVVTTALTGGAAASIWIPVLVTAGAGLVGIGLSMAIKGGRYTRAELERDLVVTLVQAATAGLGAAAGAALRGGMPAVRAVGSRLVLSEKVLERFMQIGARGGLRQGLSLGEEALIAGGSNALNSAAAAAMDPEARRRGRSGDEAFNAGLRGFVGGALGSAVMRPIMRAGIREPVPGRALPQPSFAGQAARRAFGSAASGTTTRAAEIVWDRQHGTARLSTDETVDELRGAFIQNFVQGLGEAHAEHAADSVRAARATARRGGAEPPATAHAADRAPAEIHPEAPPISGPIRQDAEGIAHTQQIREALPPDIRASAAAAMETVAPPAARLPEPAPVTARMPDEAPAQPAAAPAAEAAVQPPVTETRTRPPEAPAAAVPREPQREPAREAARPPRSGGAGDEPPGPLRRPTGAETPARNAAHPEFIEFEHLPEMTVMMDANPTSRQEAGVNYGRLIIDDPHREVALYYNPETGVHVVVQGVRDTVYVGRGAGGELEAPLPGGHAQAWKELLDSDAGRWQLLAHYHPGHGDPNTAGLARRLPSGAGGDMAIVAAESAASGHVPHQSRIHYLHEGAWGYTDFGYDPHSAAGRYWVDFEHPVTGARERIPFPTLDAYHAWVEHVTGIPREGLAAPRDPGAPPRMSGGEPPPAAPRPPAPEEIVLLHGTSRVDAENMRAQGIRLDRPGAEMQDFGGALYLTPDIENARAYAARRASDLKGEPAVVEFRVRLTDFVVVDVRPEGVHRAQWEEFLDRSPPAWGPPDFQKPPRWTTTREFFERMPGTIESRGVAFERFLHQAGLAGADIVRGDIGGMFTTGHMAHPGEQFAIRSAGAAARLSEQLRGEVEPPAGGHGAGVPRQIEDAPPAPAPRLRDALEQELDRSFDATFGPAPVEPIPPAPDRTAEERQALQAAEHQRRAAVIDGIDGAVRDRRGNADADRLSELALVGGETMRRLLRSETESGMARGLAALPGALAQPLALSDTERTELIGLVLQRRVLEHPAEAPGWRQRRAEQTVERWMTSGLRPEEIEAFISSARDLQLNRSDGHFEFAKSPRTGATPLPGLLTRAQSRSLNDLLEDIHNHGFPAPDREKLMEALASTDERGKEQILRQGRRDLELRIQQAEATRRSEFFPEEVVPELAPDEGLHRTETAHMVVAEGAERVGALQGRGYAEGTLDLRDAGWINPFENRRSRFGQGFDDVMIDGEGNYWIVEYKGVDDASGKTGRDLLSPGQMEDRWVRSRIARYRREGGDLGRFWADRLESAYRSGKLRGIALETRIAGRTPLPTRIIGRWTY